MSTRGAPIPNVIPLILYELGVNPKLMGPEHLIHMKTVDSLEYS